MRDGIALHAHAPPTARRAARAAHARPAARDLGAAATPLIRRSRAALVPVQASPSSIEPDSREDSADSLLTPVYRYRGAATLPTRDATGVRRAYIHVTW